MVISQIEMSRKAALAVPGSGGMSALSARVAAVARSVDVAGDICMSCAYHDNNSMSVYYHDLYIR